MVYRWKITFHKRVWRCLWRRSVTVLAHKLVAFPAKDELVVIRVCDMMAPVEITRWVLSSVRNWQRKGEKIDEQPRLGPS